MMLNRTKHSQLSTNISRISSQMVIAGYGISLAGLENVLIATDVGLSLQYLKADPTVKSPLSIQ